jgi:hypothetical protein
MPTPTGKDDADRVPAPGDLRIKERRSWRTWQLVLAMGIALLFGMALNYHTVDTGLSGGSAYSLPPPAGSTRTTVPTTASTTTSSTSVGTTTTSIAPQSSTTSSTASSGTTASSTVPSTPTELLLGPTQSHGNWTSATFSVDAPGWDLGWAFQCSPAPVAGPSFQVYVTPAGTSPTGAPAVNETGGSGQSVASLSTVGEQVLVVMAPANCEWAVKVTGS